METFETYDGTILRKGKKYRWSGSSSGLYTGCSWKNFKCKIIDIVNEKIYLYDYDDKIEYACTNESLRNMNATFKSCKISF